MTDDEASDRGTFSAAGSALGYLVQVDYALLLALDRMTTAENLEISLETVDDIAFHDGADATDAFQSKHHIKGRGSLGNKSVDLWKTINNWIVDSPGEITALTLMSTATAPTGSAAARLRHGAARDPAAARTALEAVSRLDDVPRLLPNREGEMKRPVLA